MNTVRAISTSVLTHARARAVDTTNAITDALYLVRSPGTRRVCVLERVLERLQAASLATESLLGLLAGHSTHKDGAR